MSEGNSTSIVNLGDWGKPANTLIKCVRDLFCGCFRPWQTKRVAKAEAEASIIRT